MDPTLSGFRPFRGAAGEGEELFLLAQSSDGDPADLSEVPCVLFRHRPSGTDAVVIGWLASSLAFSKTPAPTLCAVGLRGRVLTIGDRQLDMAITAAGETAEERGMLLGAACVDQHIYTVGMGGQIWRRDLRHSEPDAWDDVARPAQLLSPLDLPIVRAFSGIAGVDDDSVYVVGWRGEVHRFDGEFWRAIDVGTNLNFHAVAVDREAGVAAVGQYGLLTVGARDRWELVGTGLDDVSLESVAWFRGALWMASQDRLFRRRGDRIEEQTAAIGAPLTTGCLTANDRRMWSIGAEHVYFTENGDSWDALKLG